LQQLIYAAHYDQDMVAGNPRTGWVKVGLIVDLSALISEPVSAKALQLKKTWAANWGNMQSSRQATDLLVNGIDAVRVEIKQSLKNLE